MRVLHIIDSGGVYGAETVLLSLAEEQRKHGLVPVLGSIGRSGQREKPIEAQARRRNIPIVRFSAFGGPDLGAALAIVRYAKRESIDLIHTHGYKGNILLSFVPRRMRTIPILRTLHGWTNTKRFSKGALYQMLDVLSLRRTEAIVAVSRGMLEDRRLRGLANRPIAVIENGIEAPVWKQDQLDISDDIAAFFHDGRFVVGSIGRLSPEKGYRHLIAALGLLIQAGMDVKLLVIGEGPERRALENLAGGLGIRERVLLPGYREDAKQYIPRFGAYALSSMTEGLPVTLLESMHAKTPIVATAVGGVPELLRHGAAGLLVPPADPRRLAGAVRRLIEDTALREELSGNAWDIARSGYSAEAMARSYRDAYEAVVRGRGR
jgi:glycosyltransferase involved in cell wall biosynthesis